MSDYIFWIDPDVILKSRMRNQIQTWLQIRMHNSSTNKELMLTDSELSTLNSPVHLSTKNQIIN